MSTYYYAISSLGDYIFDNFPEAVRNLVFSFKESQDLLEVFDQGTKKKARMGKKTCKDGIIYVLTTEDKFINRYKLFKELLEMSTIALKPLTEFQNKIVESQNRRIEEFIHNITSLNSYGIQDLFTLIPQRILTENINKQNEIVKAIISEKPNVAVKTLLKLIKYNLSMKVEFSVFERTLQPYAGAQKLQYSIRAIILSILQIFIDDFEEKKIIVSLEATEKILSVDYDSLLVSLYYLFDNAVKYCCPNTKFRIFFKEQQQAYEVIFEMMSISINKSEVDQLCERGFRSDAAKSLNAGGHGIGMYRILKTLKINDAELKISPSINEIKKQSGSVLYEVNQFKISFQGQQDWFKTNL